MDSNYFVDFNQSKFDWAAAYDVIYLTVVAIETN